MSRVARLLALGALGGAARRLVLNVSDDNLGGVYTIPTDFDALFYYTVPDPFTAPAYVVYRYDGVNDYGLVWSPTQFVLNYTPGYPFVTVDRAVAPGSTVTVRISVHGTTHSLYLDNELLTTATISKAWDGATGMATGAGAGSPVLRMINVYTYSSAPLVVDTAYRRLLCIGDSRTDINNVSVWPRYLRMLINREPAYYDETLPRLGISGTTVAYWQSHIDDALLTLDSTPEYVLINLGVNDIESGLPDQAIWVANYGYILDAVHTFAPSAKIGVMYPGKKTADAYCTTLHSWIDTMLSSHAAYAFGGPDEMIWAKGSDDYATMYVDVYHYSFPVGQNACAAAWAAALKARGA